MSLLVPILLTVHVLVCLLLVLIVLMQLPRSEGLGAAFGGGVTENIFGAQTTHVLAKFTVWLGVAFFVLTLLLAIAYSHLARNDGSAIQRELKAGAVPAAAAAATPGATAPTTTAPAAVATPTPAALPESTPAAVAPPTAPAAVASPAAPAPAATP